MYILKVLTVSLCLAIMLGCSSQDLKSFGKDIAHNVNCDQQYNHMHRGNSLRDDCLNDRH